MHEIRVWAPRPKAVEVQFGGGGIPATRLAGGWWRAELPTDRPDQRDYGFILDGEGPFPDPRSPWQPNGIHGLSRWLDHEAFGWMDAGWRAIPLASAVIYELHVGTFTPAGTFQAAIEKLDHLVRLGVTHVELMPVNAFSGNQGWGYDGVALFAPHSSYGTPEDLKRLVDACHARQLAVILDVVYNHFGPYGNCLDKFGSYFTQRYSTPWGPALNFDSTDSAEVRRFFCDNALMWLRDYHFDGLRLDAVHAILDVSAETFLEQLAMEVTQLSAHLARPLVLIAESDLNDPRLLWSAGHGGFGLSAQWLDDFHHSLHTVLTGENAGYYSDFGTLEHLCKALCRGYVYDGQYLEHRSRRHGRPATGLDGHRFIAFLQNHDQIGNRAQGERSSQLMPVRRLKVGAALVMLSPCIPMLFQGEEWGASTPFFYFADHQKAEVQNAVREGRQREFAAFGWPPEKIADPVAFETFARSKLNWAELGDSPHGELFEWHQKLIRLRRTESALTDGRLNQVRATHDEHDVQILWLSVQRGPVTLLCNLGSQTHPVPLPPGAHRILLSSDLGAGALHEASLEMAPDSVAILKSI